MPEDAAVARRIALKSPGDGFDYPVFVERMLVGEGERVAAGRPFAIVVSARQRRRVLAAPMDGDIVEIRHSYGATLPRQDVLAVLETFAPLPQRPASKQPAPERPAPEPGARASSTAHQARRDGPTDKKHGFADRPRQPMAAASAEAEADPLAEKLKQRSAAGHAVAPAASPAARPARARPPVRDVLRVATPGFVNGGGTTAETPTSGGLLGVFVTALTLLPIVFMLAAHAGYALPTYQNVILLLPIALTIGTLMALTVLFHTRTRLGRRIGETALGLGMGAVLVVVMHGLFYLAHTPGVLELRAEIELPALTAFIRDQFDAP